MVEQMSENPTIGLVFLHARVSFDTVIPLPLDTLDPLGIVRESRVSRVLRS
jgi:hypothetical protein